MPKGKQNMITMSTRSGMDGSDLEAKIVADNNNIVGSVTRHVDAPTKVGEMYDVDATDFLEGKGPYSKKS